MKRNNRFSHESLQNEKTIKVLMEALSNGLAKGKVVLEDENDSMILEPKGLLKLKISANQDEDRSRITVRISWKGEENIPKGKSIKIHSK